MLSLHLILCGIQIKYNFDALCPQFKDDDGNRKTESVPKSQKIPLPALNVSCLSYDILTRYVLSQIKYSFKYYQHSQDEVKALRLALNDPKFRPEPLSVTNVSVLRTQLRNATLQIILTCLFAIAILHFCARRTHLFSWQRVSGSHGSTQRFYKLRNTFHKSTF